MTVEEAIQKYKDTWILTDKMKLVLRQSWIINWLWPIHSNFFVKELIEIIKNIFIKEWRWEFESDAMYHDINYYIGWSELDRKKADLWFFKRLSMDILKLNIWFFKWLYYLAFLYVAYKQVRKHWTLYFNYK